MSVVIDRPKVALITGAGRGIGRATARLAAAEGYHVCVNYVVDEGSARSVVADCVAQGVEAIAVKADVASPRDVERLFGECDRALGTVTHLVNNAGIIGERALVEGLSVTTLERVFAVNVVGTVLCSQQAIRRMSAAGGVIVNLSSVAAVQGSPNEYVHYAASKAAVETFTIGLAKEVGPNGIRVNAVQAGTTSTEIHARAGNPDRPDTITRAAPLRRCARPEEIADVVLWLMSDRSSYVSGSIVKVSGGL